jgi:hypothetical protein
MTIGMTIATAQGSGVAGQSEAAATTSAIEQSRT